MKNYFGSRKHLLLFVKVKPVAVGVIFTILKIKIHFSLIYPHICNVKHNFPLESWKYFIHLIFPLVLRVSSTHSLFSWAFLYYIGSTISVKHDMRYEIYIWRLSSRRRHFVPKHSWTVDVLSWFFTGWECWQSNTMINLDKWESSNVRSEWEVSRAGGPVNSNVAWWGEEKESQSCIAPP